MAAKLLFIWLHKLMDPPFQTIAIKLQTGVWDIMRAAGTGATTRRVERIKGLSVPQQLVLCAAIELLGDGCSANKQTGTPLKPLVNS